MDRLFYLLLFTVLIFVVGCDNEYDMGAFSIGDEFIQSETTVAIVDSYTVDMSTVFLDSVVTSAKEIMFAGSYVDDQFGVISSKSYFQIGPPTSLDMDDDEKFDSLTIKLKRKDQYYGDTLKIQTINVYRLLEEIKLNDDDNLYNTSSFRHSDDPVGTKTFKPWLDRNKDSLVIRLSDDLGLELFNKIKSNDDELESEEEFLEYLNGFALGSGTVDGAILSYEVTADTACVILHTSILGQTKKEIDYTFNLINADHQFNQISADRTGTYIEELKTKREDLPSSSTGNMSFMQAGLGIMTRLEFPGLQTLLEQDQNYLLVQAELILRPVPFTYRKIPLPEEIVLYDSDKYNNLGDEFTDDSGYSITADLTIDKIYNEDTYYSYDLTQFISDELSDAFFDVNHGVLVGLPASSLGSSIDRVVFDNRTNTIFKPQLKLYYIFYN